MSLVRCAKSETFTSNPVYSVKEETACSSSILAAVQEAYLQEEGHEGHPEPEELGAEEASETDNLLRST